MKSTTTTGIIRSFPSFDYFLEKAKHRISHFPQKHQKELKDMLVYWFEDIEELSSKLTSGNVSHQGATIRNKIIRCSKFIKEFCKTKEE